MMSAPAQRGRPAHATPTHLHPPPTHTHTLHIFPLLRGSPNCNLTICMSVGSWTAGVVGRGGLGARAALSSSYCYCCARAPGPPGVILNPRTAEMSVSLVCRYCLRVSLKAPTRGRKTCRTVAGQQAQLTTVPTARRAPGLLGRASPSVSLKEEEGGRKDLSGALVCSAGSSQS